MLFQPINMDRESCYSSSCFSAIFSASAKKRISFLKVGGFFFGSESAGTFFEIFYGSIKEVLGGFVVIFLFHPFIDTP